MSILPTQGLLQSSPHRGQDLPAKRASSPHRRILPTQGLLQSSQHRIPSGTEDSSRHRGLLSAVRGLLSAQGPPLGGTGASSRRYGPPLSGTRASSPHRGLPQSHQHRRVGPFGTVSLLPTQGPPSILSAQTTGPTCIDRASSRHRGLIPTQGLLQNSQHRISSGTEGLLSAQGSPLGGTGASSRRHRPLLGGAGASSRHSEPPPDTGASLNPFNKGDLPAQTGLLSGQEPPPDTGPPPILSAQNTFRHRGPPLGTGASSRRYGASSQRHKGLFSV